MNETSKRERGGRAYHSILAPHFEFIRDLRRQRMTWKEIAEALWTERGVRVTLYAPYYFYKRRLARSRKPHWEEESKSSQDAEPRSPSGRPTPHNSPVLPSSGFRRPDQGTFNREDYT